RGAGPAPHQRVQRDRDGQGRGVEGNIVLQMRAHTGEFVPDHPAPLAPRTQLPKAPADRRLRWDAPALHAALDARRRERGMTWKCWRRSAGPTIRPMRKDLDAFNGTTTRSPRAIVFTKF